MFRWIAVAAPGVSGDAGVWRRCGRDMNIVGDDADRRTEGTIVPRPVHSRGLRVGTHFSVVGPLRCIFHADPRSC